MNDNERELDALEASDAHRKAKELLDSYFQAETLANTPVAWTSLGSDDPRDEDRYLDVDAQKPLNAFEDHLRTHPELEAIEEWKPYFHDMRLGEGRAEEMDDAAKTQTVAHEDLRNLVNLAGEIEDMAPEERNSLERLRSTIGERDLGEPDQGLDIGY